MSTDGRLPKERPLTASPYKGNYPAARSRAFARSAGLCQFCGYSAAIEAHHWATDFYPSGDDVTADDLIALCVQCHEVATTIRRVRRTGGDVFTILAAVREAGKA